MKISIARDGNVLGDYDESEIASLARSRVLQPTDLYWRDGLPDWQPLSVLVGPEAWPSEPAPGSSPGPEPSAAPESSPVPKSASTLPPPSLSRPGPPPDPEPEPAPDPAPRPPLALSKQAIVGIALALVLLVVGVPFYFRAMRPAQVGGVAPVAATPKPTAGSSTRDPESILRAKVAGLQKPPPDLAYEDVTCEVKPADNPLATHVGIVTGRELILNHETHKTDFVLEFTATVGCQDGEWFFDHATGTFYGTSDYKKIAVSEDFHKPDFLRNLIAALPIRAEPRVQSAP